MRVSWTKLGEMFRQEETKVKKLTKVKRYHLTETRPQDAYVIDRSIATSFSLHHKILQLSQKRRLEFYASLVETCSELPMYP